MDDNNKERDRAWQLLEQVALASVTEQRRARRWGVFFKLLTFIYLLVILSLALPSSGSLAPGRAADHTAAIRIDGVIQEGAPAGADAVISGLRDAFDNQHAKGIVLIINSPGGSPVQSGYINDEIRRLRQKHPEKKVYAVIRDVGASGAYYIAVAADAIYADKASLVGSIGVTASSFGVTEAMQKLGLERRNYTAGEHKEFLSPFAPVNAEEAEFWRGVLQVTHRQFIEVVKQGRGKRLADDPKLFSGYVWSGEQALALGLVDGLGSAGFVARELVKAEELVDYSRGVPPLERFMKRLGSEFGAGLLQSMQAGSAPALY